MTVLLVDDEAQIRDVVRLYLEQAGHRVVEAGSGRSALDTFVRERPDFVVLDLMLPDLSGEQVCEALRRRSDVPILMLTAKVTEADRLRGFALGADDYLVKPFSPRELLARVQAIAQRSHKVARPDRAQVGSGDGRLVIDRREQRVTLEGRPVDLTPTELRLLEVFLTHPGQVLSREQLVSLALGADFDGSDRTVDAHIRNLRRKIEDDASCPKRILTVFGTGYRGGVL